MVLLTALFVFTFASVTKNTAVKADAADGATAVADEIHGLGDVSTTRHRPSITEPWSGSYYESSDGVFTFIIRDDYALVSRCRSDVTGTAEIPSTVEGKPVTAIGENAFSECSLNEIIIPEGVVYIGRRAFSYSNVEIVHLPNSLDEIGEDAFYSCNQLTQITLPDGLEYIGESAFCNCRKS